VSNDQRIVIGTRFGRQCRSTRGVWKAPSTFNRFTCCPDWPDLPMVSRLPVDRRIEKRVSIYTPPVEWADKRDQGEKATGSACSQ